MGALAPVSSPWIPEDDLLLKNAVEAGASLEALAKGAVCFSRRFTLSELQNRWYSLLYDRDISTEASARILEIGLSVFNNRKSSKTCSSKGKESFSEKRKLSSLRSHYHALRKRVCTIPCNYGGTEFNMPAATGHVNGNNAFDDHLNADLRFDTGQDAFPEMQRIYAGGSAVDGGSCAFSTGHMDSDAAHAYRSLCSFQTDDMIVESLDHKIPDDTSNTDRICGHGDNISQMSGDKVAGESLLQHCEQRAEHNDRPHIFEHGDFQNHAVTQETGPLPKLLLSNCFEGKNVKTKFLCAFGPSNDVQKNICASFGDNQNLKSEDLDCADSFHHLGYSSPLPEMPLWRTSHETNGQATSVVGKFEGEECGAALAIPSTNDDMSVNPPDGAPSEPGLCNEICFGEPNEGGDFMDISLSFTSDGEPFLFDVDDKGIIDKSCFDGLNNFLMSSPIDDQDPVHNKSDSKTAGILNTCHTVSHVVSTGESNDAEPQKLSEHGRGSNPFDSTTCLPDASSKILCPYGPLQGPVCCILNTQDPDIPCNDDVFLPAKVLVPFSATDLGPKSKTSLLDSSSQIFMDDRKVAPLNKTKEGKEASKHNLISAATQLCPLQPCPRQKAELRHPESASSAGVSNNSCNGSKSLTNTAISASFSAADVALNNDTTHCAGERAKFESFRDSSVEKPEGSCHAKISRIDVANVCKKVVEKPVQVCPPSHGEFDLGQIGFPGQVQPASTSDQDGRYSDNDDDLPSFSDVEAMILDMDLCPDDQESLYYAREVSRYRHMDTKKTIIRLEHGAHSYMQRAIASNGAFAVFYGRHLKYYIKKSQVLLGRGTQEICVDIDLQKEGRASKISRRQAIIEMDGNGAFSIINMGKFPIQINDKELLSGKCRSLPSGCLIEIRGMSFMFEVNCKCVTQYLSNNSRMDSKIYYSNFDRLPSKFS